MKRLVLLLFLLAPVAFAQQVMLPNETATWSVAAQDVDNPTVDGFWIYTGQDHQTCTDQSANGVPWEQCLDNFGIYLSCRTRHIVGCNENDPFTCWDFYLYICPGVDNGVSLPKYWHNVGEGTEVFLYVAVDGDPGQPPDGTVPLWLSWPDFCFGTTRYDFARCCNIRGGCQQ